MKKVSSIMILVLMIMSCSTKTKTSEDLSIRNVAGQYIVDLYQDESVDVFSMLIPEQASLPDHQTGPRVIVMLQSLRAHRLADNSEMKAEQDQVYFLSNRFSKGFKTVTKASYLVIGLKKENRQTIMADSCDVKHTEQLFAENGVLVCKYLNQNQTISDGVTLVFRPDQNFAIKYPVGEKINYLAGDMAIKLIDFK